MITKIFLMRHAKGNKDALRVKLSRGFEKKNYNTPISKEGKERIDYFIDNVPFGNVSKIQSSDYKRAVGTAKRIGKRIGKEVEYSTFFRERLHGVVDVSLIPEGYETKQWENHDYKIGNGESINETKERMLLGIKNIISEYNGEEILVVSHSTAISALISNWIEDFNPSGENYFNNIYFFDGKWSHLETFVLEIDDNMNLISITNIDPVTFKINKAEID